MSLSPMSIEREENRVGGRENAVLYPWDLEMVGRPLPTIQGAWGRVPSAPVFCWGRGAGSRAGHAASPATLRGAPWAGGPAPASVHQASASFTSVLF